MTIHAMSLNALVASLGNRTEPAASPPTSSAPPTASIDFEAPLTRLLASIEALQRSFSGDQPPSEPLRLGKTAFAENQSKPCEVSPGATWCDGSMGLRQPVEHRARILKAEQSLRLHTGFVSRDDLSLR